MSLELQSGKYIIKAKASDGAFIGRDVREDMSLLPKKILLLPKDFHDDPTWEIIRVADDKFIMKTRGSYVANIKNLLYGVLLPEPPATEWKIEAQPHIGENIFTIFQAEGGIGWVSPEEEFQQVTIRRIVVNPSYPPIYPRNELFEITRLLD